MQKVDWFGGSEFQNFRTAGVWDVGQGGGVANATL